MTDTVTAPAATDGGTRTTIHRIGGLVVTIELPADCPDPHIAVQVFTTTTTERDRAAMLTALDAAATQVQSVPDCTWVEAKSYPDASAYQHGTMRAVVFLATDDDITDPLTRAERFGQLTVR